MEEEKKVEKVETNKENNQPNKKNKKVVTSIILIILIIVAAIVMIASYHKEQKTKLAAEMIKVTGVEITTADGNINPDAEIDMEIKTKGSYAIVEKTLKDYMNKTIELSKKAETIINEKELEELLALENIIKDAPDFTNTKTEVEELRKNVVGYLDEFIALCDENNLLAAIDDKNVSERYKKLYKELAIDDDARKSLNEATQQLEDVKKEVNDSVDYLLKIVNFLSEHKGDWKAEGNRILFYNPQALREFQNLAS